MLVLARESDKLEEDGSNNNGGKRQLRLSKFGFTGYNKKSEDIEPGGKGCCKFLQACKLELVANF